MRACISGTGPSPAVCTSHRGASRSRGCESKWCANPAHRTRVGARGSSRERKVRALSIRPGRSNARRIGKVLTSSGYPMRTQGVLKGYSRGTRCVLKGYSRGTQGVPDAYDCIGTAPPIAQEARAAWSALVRRWAGAERAVGPGADVGPAKRAGMLLSRARQCLVDFELVRHSGVLRGTQEGSMPARTRRTQRPQTLRLCNTPASCAYATAARDVSHVGVGCWGVRPGSGRKTRRDGA